MKQILQKLAIFSQLLLVKKEAMKRLLTFGVLLSLSTLYLSAQTTVFLEDFETTPLSVTASSTSSTAGGWAVCTNLQQSGLRSDSAQVRQGDTLILTTNAFDVSTYSFVQLSFNHICKVDFFDQSYIEVSDDNGQTWTRLGSSSYLGNAMFINNAFSAIDYSIWDISQASLTPTNNWWQSEDFNISSLVGNSSQTKVRFVLADSDNNGALNNYGWLIDDIEILASACELTPPSVSLSGTIYQGIVYNTGPYLIEADVQDASGIDSVWLTYSVNTAAKNTLLMTNSSGSIYQANIPAANVGDSICYSILAKDASCGGNTNRLPLSSCTSFNVRNNPPPACIGTPVSTYNYSETFASFIPGNGSTTVGTLQNNWVNDANDTHEWWVYDQATVSSNTGPSADHSPGDANYLYVEGSNPNFNTRAILNSPCYDLNNLTAPKFSFWYHMNGAAMGSLSLDIFYNGQWVQNIMPTISGNQGNQWNFQEVDLSPYVGSIVKLRFVANTGSQFTSDIAIDDIAITEPPAREIELSTVFSPDPLGCSGSAQEYLTVVLENKGSATQNNIPLAYQLNNGGVVRDTLRNAIAPNSQINFTFQQTVNMSSPGSYTFNFWHELMNDAETSNDSIMNYSVSSRPSTVNFPDTTNFDNFVVGTPGSFLGGWENDPNDSYEWFVNQGSTGSLNTGPSGDHTSGLGKYVYIEATSNFNVQASLLSKCYNVSNLNKAELKFSYHMLGQDMGDLHLDISVNGVIIQDIMPVISGNQGSSWIDRTVDLSAYRGTIKLIFRGLTGSNYTSDIAIDDVIIYDAQPVGINEQNANKSTDFTIYPNPNTGLFFVRGLGIKNTLTVYNTLGRKVYEQDINQKENQLDLSHLSKGVYFVEVINEDNRQIKRMVIQ